MSEEVKSIVSASRIGSIYKYACLFCPNILFYIAEQVLKEDIFSFSYLQLYLSLIAMHFASS